MTEDEWFREFESRLAPVSDRKAQLFAAACCRRVWHLMTDPRHRAAVVAAEHFADGVLTEAMFESALRPVVALWRVIPDATRVEWEVRHYMTGATRHLGYKRCAAYAASYVGRGAARTAGTRESAGWVAARDAEGLAQLALVQDLVGPASRPAADPSWLTSIVLALAGQMYELRDFSVMPILADALEEAGCDDVDVLGHCRSSGPHVRGCWVVDLVLGKE
jgi:hypothetical protein